MQIVIDIDDKEYEEIIDNKLNKSWDMTHYERVIANGIPLPKGHGKLKDFDKIEWYGCDLEGRGCIEAKGDCSVCNHANCYAKQVRELPTIIKADKAESEDKKGDIYAG